MTRHAFSAYWCYSRLWWHARGTCHEQRCRIYQFYPRRRRDTAVRSLTLHAAQHVATFILPTTTLPTGTLRASAMTTSRCAFRVEGFVGYQVDTGKLLVLLTGRRQLYRFAVPPQNSLVPCLQPATTYCAARTLTPACVRLPASRWWFRSADELTIVDNLVVLFMYSSLPAACRTATP